MYNRRMRRAKMYRIYMDVKRGWDGREISPPVLTTLPDKIQEDIDYNTGLSRTSAY